MKSSIVLGLGLAAFTIGAASAPTPAAVQPEGGANVRPLRSRFTADARGTVNAQHTGRVALGPAGRQGEPGASYTITLGADGAAGAIVFTRLAGARPEPGRYPIGESAALDSAGGFRVLYLAGDATRPEGIFRAETGTLDITAGGPGRVSGSFEFVASGFVADRPADESGRVRVTGVFHGTGYLP